MVNVRRAGFGGYQMLQLVKKIADKRGSAADLEKIKESDRP